MWEPGAQDSVSVPVGRAWRGQQPLKFKPKWNCGDFKVFGKENYKNFGK